MLISNPLASILFLPTLVIVVGLLGAILLALVVVERFNPRRLLASVLFARWRVWAIIAPVYALAVLSGGLTTLGLVGFLVVQGLREYGELVGLPASYRRVLLVAGVLPLLGAMVSYDAVTSIAPILLIVATLQALLFRDHAGAIRNLAFAVLGWGYLAWFLSYMVLIETKINGGPGILLAIGLGTALSDVGAFTVGKSIGRHKLALAISPNKTWEGVLGNVAGAYLGLAVMAFALPDRSRWLLVAIVPLVVALGSVWGDLLESSIKREFAAKDAGAWLPGFGGLLDRIDSLIIVVPLVFYAVRLVG